MRGSGWAKFKANKCRIMRDGRRSEPRWRGEYLATLVPGNGEPRYCLVSDMSDGGVRINAVGLRVPDEFGLRLSGHGYTKSYRVIWRNGHDVGAKLISLSPSTQADPSEIRAK
jgi:hypothetical protein